jgi:cyclophilin family peptidyl-prolyl cis-trans isomerase
VPSDKRSRQRTNRAARVVELQKAQVRHRRRTRVLPITIVVAALVVFLIVYTGTSHGKKKASSSTSTTSTTSSTPTTVGKPGSGLVARAAPAVSAACNTPAGGQPGTGAAPASRTAGAVIPAPAHVPFPHLDGSSPHYTKFQSAPPFCINANKTYTATMVTDIGTVTIKLLPKYAPLTVNNFVFLAGYHYYNGIIFHRVIPSFMDQSGDPLGTGGGGPGYQFKDELPTTNAAYPPGALAMANSGSNTNGSQFFIVVPGGGSQLQPLYSVFGQVESGLNVVEKINSDGSSSGAPSVTHKIISVSITES